MEAMLGIALLCIAILISISKIPLSFLLLLMSTLQQNWRRVQKKFCLEVRRVGGGGEWREGREMAQTMYAHMNK
jgi:hypothetical protein